VYLMSAYDSDSHTSDALELRLTPRTAIPLADRSQLRMLPPAYSFSPRTISLPNSR
jgi:hypothetical protein